MTRSRTANARRAATRLNAAREALNKSIFVIPAVHGCCRFGGFRTMAYPLRVKAGIQ